MKEELPVYLFHQGTNYRSYDLLGSHAEKRGKSKGVVFRTWAPNAKYVKVIGDFCDWNEEKALPMQKISGGIFEGFAEGILQYCAYKYLIETEDNRILYKADPFAFHSETNGATASKYYELPKYEWRDGNWKKYCDKTDIFSSPMNIYEVHLGSWKKNEDGSPYDYRRLANELSAYVSEMGYTHIEILPVTEYPFDGSWGYQVTGFFSVTSRYGTPEDFMYFVDKFHQNGIGVLLDWVPGHFPKDAHGLYEYDGLPLYECQGLDRMEHKGWGTRIFDYGREEVQSFLVSSALFFLEKYHIDGLRVDAVASMIYLDYGREKGGWIPNVNGDNKNLDAIAFLKKLCKAVKDSFPKALMIAEESTSFQGITQSVDKKGLGFSYKWNMGWMNDLLKYCVTDPFLRKYQHDKLTFSLFYAFSEHFILPISHDEVVHGKKSLLDKMPGDYHQKFANLRAFLGFMTAHPGKKLMFMGSEFGQFIEWDYKRPLDWFLLSYEMHRKTQNYVKALNNFYLSRSPLWEIDCSWEGFYWNNANDSEQNIVSFTRTDKSGNELLVVINFAPVLRENYCLGVKEGGYDEIFTSDSEEYGGGGVKNGFLDFNGDQPMHGFSGSIRLTVPPMSALFFERKEKSQVLPKGEDEDE